jgi:hypothetical protein
MSDLANVTKARNNELEMRVQQLERELVACQNFHNAVPLSGGSALKTPAKDVRRSASCALSLADCRH